MLLYLTVFRVRVLVIVRLINMPFCSVDCVDLPSSAVLYVYMSPSGTVGFSIVLDLGQGWI